MHGGFVQPDEANTNYADILRNFEIGKSFLRQESAYGRKSHHATTIYGGAIQIQVNKGTRKRTNPFPGGDEEKKS